MARDMDRNLSNVNDEQIGLSYKVLFMFYMPNDGSADLRAPDPRSPSRRTLG
jgi:hypothetical protein